MSPSESPCQLPSMLEIGFDLACIMNHLISLRVKLTSLNIMLVNLISSGKLIDKFCADISSNVIFDDRPLEREEI